MEVAPETVLVEYEMGANPRAIWFAMALIAGLTLFVTIVERLDAAVAIVCFGCALLPLLFTGSMAHVRITGWGVFCALGLRTKTKSLSWEEFGNYAGAVRSPGAIVYLFDKEGKVRLSFPAPVFGRWQRPSMSTIYQVMLAGHIRDLLNSNLPSNYPRYTVGLNILPVVPQEPWAEGLAEHYLSGEMKKDALLPGVSYRYMIRPYAQALREIRGAQILKVVFSFASAAILTYLAFQSGSGLTFFLTFASLMALVGIWALNDPYPRSMVESFGDSVTLRPEGLEVVRNGEVTVYPAPRFRPCRERAWKLPLKARVHKSRSYRFDLALLIPVESEPSPEPADALRQE